MTIDEAWAYLLRLAPRTPRFRRDFEKLLDQEGLNPNDITAEWVIRKLQSGWFYP